MNEARAEPRKWLLPGLAIAGGVALVLYLVFPGVLFGLYLRLAGWPVGRLPRALEIALEPPNWIGRHCPSVGRFYGRQVELVAPPHP